MENRILILISIAVAVIVVLWLIRFILGIRKTKRVYKEVMEKRANALKDIASLSAQEPENKKEDINDTDSGSEQKGNENRK